MELHLIKPIEWRSSSRCMSLPAPANLFHLCRINLSVCKWCGRLCRRQQTGPPASWLCSPLYAAPQQFLLHKLLYYGSFVTQFVCTNIILIQNILRSVLIFASKYFTYYFVYKLLLQNYGHIYEVVVPQFYHWTVHNYDEILWFTGPYQSFLCRTWMVAL